MKTTLAIIGSVVWLAIAYFYGLAGVVALVAFWLFMTAWMIESDIRRHRDRPRQTTGRQMHQARREMFGKLKKL